MNELCWMWTGELNSKGYGRIRVGQRKVAVHRFVYEALVGPIPPGLVMDHLCRERRCFNPAHVEPVTHRQNIMRGKSPSIVAYLQDTCQRGHALTGANVKLNSHRDGSVRRQCRECISQRCGRRQEPVICAAQESGED